MLFQSYLLSYINSNRIWFFRKTCFYLNRDDDLLCSTKSRSLLANFPISSAHLLTTLFQCFTGFWLVRKGNALLTVLVKLGHLKKLAANLYLLIYYDFFRLKHSLGQVQERHPGLQWQRQNWDEGLCGEKDAGGTPEEAINFSLYIHTAFFV